MRYGFMSAARSMHVARLVSITTMSGRTNSGVLLADFDDMFINMVSMWMVEMPVMKIINVVAMFYGGMSATRSMLVRMIFVFRILASSHIYSPALDNAHDFS